MHFAQLPLEQIGAVGSVQLELVRHCTQLFDALQYGVLLAQALAFVPVHFAQAPLLLHAGALLPLRCEHSLSPAVGGLPWLQPRQLYELVSQIGAVAVVH